MRDEAAAAARRIVEEVLARHGQGDALTTETVAPPDARGPAGAAAEESAPTAPADRDGSFEVQAQGHRPDDETALLAAAGDAASEAAQIARRIVAEALAEADERSTQEPPGGLAAAQPEVSVRGVPAAGLSVDDEQTVDIEVTDAPADTGDRSARGGAATVTSAGAMAAPASGSAEEIVRRIVADVQAEASTPADQSARAGSATSPDADAESLDGGRRRKQDATAVLEEQEPETPTAALPEQPSVAVGASPDLRSGGDPAAVMPVPRRELEGWATPLGPEPSGAVTSTGGAPRTLRWLLASLLGAVALAVLFPLAVAALRALVAL